MREIKDVQTTYYTIPSSSPMRFSRVKSHIAPQSEKIHFSNTSLEKSQFPFNVQQDISVNYQKEMECIEWKWNL